MSDFLGQSVEKNHYIREGFKKKEMEILGWVGGSGVGQFPKKKKKVFYAPKELKITLKA